MIYECINFSSLIIRFTIFISPPPTKFHYLRGSPHEDTFKNLYFLRTRCFCTGFHSAIALLSFGNFREAFREDCWFSELCLGSGADFLFVFTPIEDGL